MVTKSIVRTTFLSAAECNAQLEIPIPYLVQLLIEAATEHANALSVGFARLSQDNISWVLMRLTLSLERLPRVHETIEIDTWVESFNRRFSQRNFEIRVITTDGRRQVLGHAFTVWTTIHSQSRQAATLDGLEELDAVITHRDVEQPRAPRVRPSDFAAKPEPDATYRVAVSDIDTNRHLTSARYLQLMLDLWDLDFYDHNTITLFEIAFSSEARYADRLTLRRLDLSPTTATCQLSRGSDSLSIATLSWRPRP